MKKILIYDDNGDVVRTEPIGMDADNVSVSVDGLDSTDAQSAIEEVNNALSNITSGSGFTSGVVVDDVGAVQQAVGNIAEGTNINGMAVSDVLKAAYASTPDKVTLLHLSDTHGGTASINACVQDAKNDEGVALVLHTGDIASSASYNALLAADCEQPVLGILGNHDSWDNYAQNNSTAVNAMRTLNGNNVTWAGNDVCYWYKDIQSSNGKTIRIIAPDEYDYSNGAGHIYSIVYTQQQMEWLLDLLYNTPSNYYIILAIHQPPQSNTGAADDWTSYGTTSYSGPDAYWLPKIIDAYTRRIAFQGTFKPVYKEALNFSVFKDFSTLEQSATFLCYLCGHMHGDWCGYLNSYPDQLVLDVTRADSVASVGHDDVDRTSISYAANKVTFDFALRKIIIKRIGSTALTGGGVRKYKTFDF
jgi:hypothetical protein